MDRNIRDDVEAEVAFDPFVDGTDITVTVENGNRVVLSGSVPTFAQSDQATDAAWRVSNVTDVTNNLFVDLHGASVADADLADRANQALSWNTAVPDAVVATADSGTVTLSGSVDWAFERDAAYNAVRYLIGVRRVLNDIVVAPTVDVSDVDGAIGAALARIALVEDGSVISISSDGTTVYLDGHVRTWAERDAVDDAAWMAPGVADVQDRLLVTG